MLHEILLSLSGHPSPLFEDGTAKPGAPPFPLLSPSERELLKTIGRLSTLHREIRIAVQAIIVNHKSPICKAVASTVENFHLAKFQRKILDVEAAILKQDSSIVGAYNIVPLAAIVSEFDDSHRLLDWLWEIACYIRPQSSDRGCSGPDLVNKLRKSTQTGYPEIEGAAIHLSKAAEAAWLLQLASWILYGQLSKFDASDFFIQPTIEEDITTEDYELNHRKIPVFLSKETADSILFVGKALHQISSRIQQVARGQIQSQLDLLPSHQRILSNIPLPISSPHLSEAVESIRLSLSRNILQKLLPVDQVLQLLLVLRQFFLLEQGEFAISLIREADDRIKARDRYQLQNPASKDSIRGLVMKEGEVTSILSKTWIHLSALAGSDDGASDLLDFGRDLIRLSIGRTAGKGTKDSGSSNVSQAKTKNTFAGYLLPIPTYLDLKIIRPFDLFISPSDVQTYSALNMYLLSIRRGHIHLADLWKQSAIRRDHPTPIGPPRSCTAAGSKLLESRRQRSRKRYVEMRKVWATCSAVIYLLNELGEYLEGQVIPPMWDDLVRWVASEPHVKDAPKSSQNGHESTSGGASRNKKLSLLSLTEQGSTSSRAIAHDPATLSRAHKAFLLSLNRALLFTDSEFTSVLSALLTSVDDLIAQVLRLQTIQRNLDLEEDEGIYDALSNYSNELRNCWTELDRARKRVDSASKSVVQRLKSIGNNPSTLIQDGPRIDNGYHPAANSAKLEWLLMKLEYRNHDDAAGSPESDYD